MGGEPTCKDRKISATEVVGPVEQSSQGVSSRWTERWTVNRCGSLVPYLVKFARSPEGNLDVTMQLETPKGEPGTVAGLTLADTVLQRDALGFLAQRDFWLALNDPTRAAVNDPARPAVATGGTDVTCQARKVINTEVLQPLEGGAVQDGRPIEGKWTERWTLDRCGKPIRYVVRFSTTPKGTTFTAEPEP